MKKQLFIIGLLLAVCTLLSGCNEKHVYTESDKVPYSLLETRFLPSGMETNTLLSDLIFEGVISSDAKQITKIFEGGAPVVFTSYEVEVDHIWFGEEETKEITVWFMGTKPELHKKDIVVFYVAWNEENICYMPVDNECSVFVLNPPDGMVFSLTRVKTLSEYDGANVSDLQEQTQQILKDLKESGSPYPSEKSGLFGDIADLYYEEYLSAVEGEVTE